MSVMVSTTNRRVTSRPTMADAGPAQGSSDVRRMMAIVVLALVPTLLARALIDGTNSLINAAVCLVTAVAIELTLRAIHARAAHRPVDLSSLVTALLLAAVLPAALPWYIAIIATSTALLLGKEAFGGLGRNPFNPAMVGIAMALVLFPRQFTHAVAAADGAAHWQQSTISWLAQDMLLCATSLGGGLAMRYLRIISWHAPLGMLVIMVGGAALLCGLEVTGLEAHGPGTAINHDQPLFPWLSSTTLLYAWFIVTDPVSGATTRNGQFLFGALVGTLLSASYAFDTQTMAAPFAVLIANAAVPWIDRLTLRAPRHSMHATP